MLVISKFLAVYVIHEREKFDAKARRCIMLEYGTETKAYRVYDLKKKKIIFSQNVVFDETKNAIKEDDDPPRMNLVQSLYN